jgi:hypothetical protein
LKNLPSGNPAVHTRVAGFSGPRFCSSAHSQSGMDISISLRPFINRGKWNRPSHPISWTVKKVASHRGFSGDGSPQNRRYIQVGT